MNVGIIRSQQTEIYCPASLLTFLVLLLSYSVVTKREREFVKN